MWHLDRRPIEILTKRLKYGLSPCCRPLSRPFCLDHGTTSVLHLGVGHHHMAHSMHHKMHCFMSTSFRAVFSANGADFRLAMAWATAQRKSPRHRVVRASFSLLFQVCSLLFDLHVSIFYQPLPLFPVPLLCTAGAARYLPPYYSTVSQIVCSIIA